MRIYLIVLLTLIASVANGQHRKLRFPVWTFHQKNVDIYGVSLGLASTGSAVRNTYTTGIKIEIIGLGLFVPLIPRSPVAEDDSAFHEIMSEPLSERINGLSLSASGTVCNCDINGGSFGIMGQIHRKVVGISGAFFMNFSQVHHGIQSAFFNEAYQMRGLQIGVFTGSKDARGIQSGLFNVASQMRGMQIGVYNRSKDTRGIQFGLLNKNERRLFPIVNWNFKSKTGE